MRGWSILFIIAIPFSTLFSTSAIAQAPEAPSASQQIAAAVLPLPEVMRERATVLGYAPDLSLVTLRPGSNGMVCTASRPGDDEFDVRCYHESFMPVVRRLRELHSQGVKQVGIDRIIDAEAKAKKLAIPDHPTAGYRIVVVGQGAEKRWLRENMRQAEFTGVLTGKDLSRAFANMDVLAFPSETDTFGLVVLEALASGVPASTFMRVTAHYY